MDAANELTCANCGTSSRADTYCPHCGQKHPQAGDLSLKHAWRHVVDEVFNLDGRIFDTLKLLFTKPGLLTLDFLEGRRARHVHPIRLFLTFSAIYFLAAGETMSSRIRTLTRLDTDAMPELQRALIEDFAHTTFKIAFISTVLLNGLLLWLFLHRRRPLLAENMVTALHLSCITMTLTVVVETIVSLLQMPNLAGGLLGALFANFGWQSIRRAYHEPSPWLAGLCLIVIIAVDLAIVSGATGAAVYYRNAAFN